MPQMPERADSGPRELTPLPQQGMAFLTIPLDNLPESLRGLDIEIREVRKRRNCRLTILIGRSGSTERVFVVKELAGSTSSGAEYAHQLLLNCAWFARRSGIPSFAPLPEGFVTRPPQVCYEWIVGEDLSHWLRRNLKERGSEQKVLELAAEAGRILAYYHLAAGVQSFESDNFGDAGNTSWADRHYHRAVWMLGERSTPAVDREILCHSFDDPGLSNFVVRADGTLCLIDMPTRSRLVPIGYDLGKLLSRIERLFRSTLRRHSILRSAPGLPHRARDAAYQAYVVVMTGHGHSLNERELRISFVRDYLLGTYKEARHLRSWGEPMVVADGVNRVVRIALASRFRSRGGTLLVPEGKSAQAR